MIHIIKGFGLTNPLAAAMFAERKKVFVDLLGWSVPVTNGRFEIDQYDGCAATYIIAEDERGHSGSMRLLPTSGPHLLGDLFAELCDDMVPRGERIFEITRLCLAPRLGTAGRLRVRNQLISAMVDHALVAGITGLTGVVSQSFRDQILAMGWQCTPLGPSRRVNGALLGAFRIHVDADTPARLAATGIYASVAVTALPVAQAA